VCHLQVFIIVKEYFIAIVGAVIAAAGEVKSLKEQYFVLSLSSGKTLSSGINDRGGTSLSL
jgi:hypothetical protein